MADILNPYQKDQLETELMEQIIPAVGTDVPHDTTTRDLADAIARSIGSRNAHFPGYEITKIYRNKFDNDASQVFNYLVKHYEDLLRTEGVYDRYSPSRAPTQPPVATPDPASGGSSNMPLIIVALVAGYFLIQEL